MNRNEQEQRQYDDILDAVMKNALINNADSYFDDIPSEEEIMQSHSFSPEFLRNMELLLKENRPSGQRRLSPAREETEPSPGRLDQSFWEEWKQRTAATASSGSGTPAAGSGRTGTGGARPAGRPGLRSGLKTRRLRWPAKAAIATAALIGAIGIFRLSNHGFLRASRTPNVIDYQGKGTLITNMAEDDYTLMFKAPSFVPKGYHVVSDHRTDYMRVLEYSDGTNILRISYTFSDEDPDAINDKERHVPEGELVRIKDRYTASLSDPQQSGAYTVLSWENGLVQYKISGYESKETLIRIAEDIMP